MLCGKFTENTRQYIRPIIIGNADANRSADWVSFECRGGLIEVTYNAVCCLLEALTGFRQRNTARLPLKQSCPEAFL